MHEGSHPHAPISVANPHQSTVLLEERICTFLMQRYGPVLDRKAIVETLRFPSGDAFDRAVERGQLKLEFLKMSNRKGRFALAQRVAQYLAQTDERSGLLQADEERVSPRKKEWSR